MPFELVSPVINGLVETRFLSDTSIIHRLYTHSTAQCTLDTDDVTAQDYAGLSALGAQSLNADVLLRWHSKDLTETVDCFRGYVRAVRAERVQDRSYVNLECVSNSARLDQVRNFRVWERCTLKDVCSYLIDKNRNDLAFGEDGESLTGGIPIPLSVQYDETDFAYLTRMLHAWGVPMAVDDLNRKVYIGKPDAQVGGAFPAVDWHWERVTMDADLIPVQTSAQGAGDAAPGMARSKTQEFNSALSRTAGHLYAPKLDEEHQEVHRQIQQHEDETSFNAGAVVCRAQWLGGVFEYLPGALADFAGQSWLVREVAIQSHDEKGTSEWVSQEFTLLDKLMPLIPLHRRVPWPAHCLWAHVTQNDNQDPAQRGHIQVQFDWEPDESTGTQRCWLPTVTPYGGLKSTSGTSGFLSLPEIGEHVLVQFLDGWDCAAVVIGSIREHEAQGFAYLPHDTKRWQTPSGNQISLTTRDKGTIDIVEIKCKDKLIFRGEIEPGKDTVVMDLTNSGDDRIHFEKSAGPAQLDIFCSGNIYMHAAQQMMIEGGQIQIKSTMGPVKIDGTPLVMLNCGPISMSPLHLETIATGASASEAGVTSLPMQPGSSSGGKTPPPNNPTPHIQSAPRVYKTKPTVDQIKSDPTVDAELKRAWSESNPNAPEVPRGQPGSTKMEQGGWIVWNKKSGQLEVIRVPAGNRDGLGTILGTRPPDNADQEVVSWFHTHPNVSGEGYSHSPSPGDIGYQRQQAKAPGIIETHEGRKVIPYP